MTHFARPAALAESLDPAEWDVHFRTPRRLHGLLNRSFDSLGDLWTQDPAAFLSALARGAVLYSEETLRRYVEEDLRIIREVEPDLIVGDYRLSLCVSAPLSRVPFASIFNAHWSPYRRQPAIVPSMPMTRWIPAAALNPAFALLRPAFYALHARPVNAVRRSFGLPPVSRDLRHIYTAGDLVLYPDVPELVPVPRRPAHHYYIGACPWAPATPLPSWWSAVMESSEPKVFVSLGSSGPVQALPAVLDALSGLPVTIVLATSGRHVDIRDRRMYVADLLPYEETARRSAVVVSHGGTGGLYPTLSAGTPMLAIPANIDMQLSASILQESGAGLHVRVENASPARLRRALERLLFDPKYERAASRWAVAVAGYDTRFIFPALLRSWFGRAGEGGAADGVVDTGSR